MPDSITTAEPSQRTIPKATTVRSRRRVHKAASNQQADDATAPLSAGHKDADVPTAHAGGLVDVGHAPSASQEAPANVDQLASVVDLYKVRKSLVFAEGDMKRRIKSKGRSTAAYRMRQHGIATPEGKMPEATAEDMAVVARVYPSFYTALDVIAAQKSAEEKELVKQVKHLPIMAWAGAVRGLAAVSVATLIGEAGGTPMVFNTPSKLWKRYGLAVIDGKSQRKSTDAEMAVRQGYNPSRRSAIYVIGDNMIRAGNIRARAIYDEAKAKELAKIEAEPELKMTKGWAHKRALRKVQKQLVLAFWLVWKAQDAGITDPEQWPDKARVFMGSGKATKPVDLPPPESEADLV